MLGSGLELVGRDGQPDAAAVQLSQQIDHPGIRTGVHVDVLHVIGLEGRQALVHQGFIGLQRRRERLHHQIADAMAHHLTVFLPGMARKTFEVHGMVDGLSQILQRIDERTVQIEDNYLVFHS